MVQERAQAVRTAGQHAPRPRSLIADSTLYHAAKAANLQQLGCITRIPHTIGAVSPVITPALAWDTWQRLDDPTRDQRLELCHAGMAQRWLVVASQAARERAEATRTNARQREDEAIETPRLHLHAQRCPTPEAAQEALATVATGWRYPQVAVSPLREHIR